MGIEVTCANAWCNPQPRSYIILLFVYVWEITILAQLELSEESLLPTIIRKIVVVFQSV